MEIIKIMVDDIENIFNKFDNMDISDELATYIENRCSRVKKQPLKIEIYTKQEINETIQDKIVNAIRTHFGLETKYNLIDTKQRKIINIIYFLSGFFIMFFKNLLPLTSTIKDIVDVLGCFIIWESTFNLLFTDNQMDLKTDRAKKISNCRIVFKVK